MPEMATICQETTSTPPNMFSPRGGPQGVGPAHTYYNHCGYPANSGHAQYGSDGYVPFQMDNSISAPIFSFRQHKEYLSPVHEHRSTSENLNTSPPEQTAHLQNHVHGHQQQHHQQAWSYGMGVSMMGSGRSGVLPDEWAQSYLVPGNSTPTQNVYNYQYRGQSCHGPLDYATPLQVGHDTDPQVLEGSPSPNSSSPGEPTTTGMGPNNQGAKSLRPPYEWMKPSASLPQAGKTRTKDKYRVVYSDHQRLELEKEFHFSKYITIRRKAEIASQLGLSERQVKIWFQNRRAKERKQNKKREEQVTVNQHGGNNNNNNTMSNGSEHQQRLHLSSSHDPHPHTFIPKLELDDDKSNLHELTCHSTTLAQGAGLPSHSAPPTSIVLHPNLHHSPIMSMSPIIMSRGNSHSAIGRYHENVQTTTISPNTSPDGVAYRMASNADPTGNMNLSGSSDSGVVSSH